MNLAAGIICGLGTIPGVMALYWAHKRWQCDDSPEAAKYFRTFLIWAAIFFAFWAIGIALDMRSEPSPKPKQVELIPS